MKNILILCLLAVALSGCTAARLDGYQKALSGIEEAVTAAAPIVSSSDKAFQHAVADAARAKANDLDESGNHQQAEEVKAEARDRLKIYEVTRDAVVLPTVAALKTGAAVAHATLAAGRAMGEVPPKLPAQIAALAAYLTTLASFLPAMDPGTPIAVSPDGGISVDAGVQ